MDIDNEIRLLKEAADNLIMVSNSLNEREAYGALELTPLLDKARVLTETSIIFLDSSNEIAKERGESSLLPTMIQEH